MVEEAQRAERVTLDWHSPRQRLLEGTRYMWAQQGQLKTASMPSEGLCRAVAIATPSPEDQRDDSVAEPG